MTSREQFELVWKGSEISDDDTLKQIAWAFWKASREAVEVELPPAINTEEIGRAISKERTMTRLALAGIKVIKGEKKNG
ncbi:hypothetical protein [Hafnia alvei]|uniref:hypothetical protein n=1 Tax=Hafnia alvei TaxID=569 RepID=UPI000583F0A2|nr:hypothetical protein [Hafnia alvei]KID03529.1 hypothetical protein PU00_11530 [Hafnia alvei]QBJ32906.1 hypothetical protein EYZ02_08375 [Hafnia alvei]